MSFGLSITRKAPQVIPKALREVIPVFLSATVLAVQTIPITVDAQTSRIVLRLRRPTTAVPVNWDAASSVQTTLVITIDGSEYRGTGSSTGGIQIHPSTFQEIAWYQLMWTPPWGHFNGPQNPTRRLGETAQSSYTAHVELTRLSGVIQTDLDVVSEQAPAPVGS